MTHEELVSIAARWLTNTLHCRVVLTEPRAITAICECPDVIGWVRGKSIVVECKTSYADFLADKKKLCRQEGYEGLGHWRFYLSLPSLIHSYELPDGWGLYVVKGQRIHHAGGKRHANAVPRPFESSRDDEVRILLQAVAKAEWERKEVL
jgi:hypothetical protein